jgi:hypothetical protein
MTIASTKTTIGQFSAEGAARIQDAVAALTSKSPRHFTDGAAIVINVGTCAYDVELHTINEWPREAALAFVIAAMSEG